MLVSAGVDIAAQSARFLWRGNGGCDRVDGMARRRVRKPERRRDTTHRKVRFVCVDSRANSEVRRN